MTRRQSPARGFRLLVLAAISVAVFVWLRDPALGTAAISGHARHADCGVPIHAFVNDVDPRFGFDRHDVERALNEASALWQAHADRPLFSPDARRRPMPVDLVFDERQQQADARDVHSRSLDRAQRRLEDDRAAVERLGSRIESDRDAYRRAEDAFNRRVAEHDRRVSEWNANPAVRSAAAESRLRAEAAELQAERDRLAQLRTRLDTQVAEANRLARQLDSDAERFNREVAAFNRSAATPVTAGGYSYDARSGRRITVYRASSHDELVLVLAHELGHALGIGHVESDGAVMQAVPEGVSLPVRRLPEGDVQVLQRVCGA